MSEVVLANSERSVRRVIDEAANVSEWVAYAEAEATAWAEHACDLSDAPWHVGDNLKGVVGDRQFEAPVRERQGGCVR
jgi:hypothetical protein